MERETGIEPATSSLGSWRSTAELLPLFATGSGYHRHGLRAIRLLDGFNHAIRHLHDGDGREHEDNSDNLQRTHDLSERDRSDGD